MEAGPFAGAPAGIEEQAAPAPAEPAAPAPEPTPAPPAPVEGGATSTPEDPVLAAIEKLNGRIDEMANPEAETDPMSLLEQLAEEDPAEYGEPEAPAAPAEQQFEDPAAQQQMAELRQLIREEARAEYQPDRDRMRVGELNSIEKEYPDITSEAVFNRLKPALEDLAQTAGNPELVQDPKMVRLVYKAVKAELADIDAVPAEQAATSGASLETNAGQTQQAEPSVADLYIQSVYPKG